MNENKYKCKQYKQRLACKLGKPIRLFHQEASFKD